MRLAKVCDDHCCERHGYSKQVDRGYTLRNADATAPKSRRTRHAHGLEAGKRVIFCPCQNTPALERRLSRRWTETVRGLVERPTGLIGSWAMGLSYMSCVAVLQ
jgi:hypothetical protein